MVRVFRAQSYARSIVEPQPAARLLPRRNLQPFATPDTLDPVLATLPAFSLQQRRDATVAIASILSGKIGDGPGERVFILAPCQMVALGAAWLVHQPARPPFAHALFLRMIYRTAPSFRA